MNVQKVYEYALKREEEGYRFFSEHAEKAAHAAASGIFAKLAEEELRHIDFIKQLLQELHGDDDSPAGTLQGDDWFAGRAREELLDQALIESMIPDVAVLRTAYLIEHDLAEFYEGAASRSSGRAQKALSQLAAWERAHEALFKELHDKVFHEYTQMPWGG